MSLARVGRLQRLAFLPALLFVPRPFYSSGFLLWWPSAPLLLLRASSGSPRSNFIYENGWGINRWKPLLILLINPMIWGSQCSLVSCFYDLVPTFVLSKRHLKCMQSSCNDQLNVQINGHKSVFQKWLIEVEHS